MRRAWWVLAVLLTAVLPASATRAADQSGGRITLHNPVRVLDTRACSVSLTGCRVTSSGLGPGFDRIWVTDWTAPGKATIHACDDPASTVAVFDLEIQAWGGDRTAGATLATGNALCLTSTTPVNVILDRRGSISAEPTADAEQYVALDAQVELLGPTVVSQYASTFIPRPAELAADATAAVLSIEVLDAAGTGYLTAYACDNAMPVIADTSFSAGTPTAVVAAVVVDPLSALCIHSAYSPVLIRVELLGELRGDGPDPTALPPAWRSVPSDVPPPSVRPVAPARVLDTREGLGRPGVSKVEPNEVVELKLPGRVGSDSDAVLLNVTVTEPESAGFVTVWPCGGTRPTASNLNFAPGETVPNLVMSRLGVDDRVCLSGIARTHLIADLAGTIEGDGGEHAVPVDPVRILDTRDTALGPGTSLSDDSVLELAVAGEYGVPLTATSVTLNVTVTQPVQPGFVTVFPCGDEVPTASNVNYATGQTVPNLVTVPLSADGTVCFYTLGETHLIADLAAWYGFGEADGVIAVDPVRTLDTRTGLGAASAGAIPAGQFTRLQLGGAHGIPSDATAVVMNVTVTEPADLGFVTAWPCDRDRPVVSNVNFAPGETVPNLVTVRLAGDGSVCLYTHARAHLLADVSAYLTSTPVPGEAFQLLPAPG
jgi:hypothetical protein